jgi:hypothetical protein
MASPNYQFEKRRRELEKKAKKQDKLRKKLDSAKSSPSGNSDQAPAQNQ